MRFEFKVVIGFIFTLSLVIAIGFYTYHNNDNQLKASRWVNHTHKVLYHAEQVLSTLTDIETGQRGFCLTGNLAFLVPYSQGKQNITPQLQTLRQLTYDNPRQLARVEKLETLIKQKLAFSDEVVETYKTDPAKSIALVTSMKGKKLMDSIRLTFSDLSEEEHALLERRTLENDKQSTKANLVFVLAMSSIVFILLILFFAIYINLRARKIAEEKLEAAALDIQDLYDNAPCGYHSLDENGFFVQANNTLCEWLGYTKEELIGKKQMSSLLSEDGLKLFRENFPKLKEYGFINNLECELQRKDGTVFQVIASSTAVRDDAGNYLKSRTTTFDYTEQKIANDKINTLNQELEAFTYTVSHDLRSPLRSISGYAQILEEDYSQLLDDEGKRVTNVIIKSSKRMGQLIDDLLNFSQIGRRDLSNHLIDANTLVNQLAKELKELETHPLEINIQNLDPCHGDFNMMRQVWYNLLSNAIKYSKKKDLIHIEVGSYTRGPEVVYYVKDNGAGFDMQYVHKLFGVFQRLHRLNEFEGTGVGLAIVKRIVTRHGGRVWAEAQQELGATFYFSIPN